MTVMSSRDSILERLRKNTANLQPPEQIPLPAQPLIFENLLQQFSQMLEAVGGKLLQVSSHDEIQKHMAEEQQQNDAEEVGGFYSSVPEIIGSFREPVALQSLSDLPAALFNAAIGVAENAACWVRFESDEERRAAFLCEHLYLVLHEKDVLHNMHQAYDRISKEGGPGLCGLFISGPSKTADIEQCLVLGAQGPRQMTLFLVG